MTSDDCPSHPPPLFDVKLVAQETYMSAFRAFDPSSCPQEQGYSTTADPMMHGYAPEHHYQAHAHQEDKVGFHLQLQQDTIAMYMHAESPITCRE